MSATKINFFKKNSFLFGGIFFMLLNLLFAEYVYKINYSIIIWSDAEGYYQYLPYLFIKNDLAHQLYAVILDNGMTLNVYTCGVAILQTPFFLAAHLFSKIFGLVGNGYTSVYGYSILVSAVFYAYIGLMFIYKTLKVYFTRNISLLSVTVLYTCTNLFYYTLCEPGMSHIYSFAALAFFVWRIHLFFDKVTLKNTLLFAFPIGIAILIRPTNIFYILLIPLFRVNSLSLFRDRVKFLFSKYQYMLLAIVAVVLCFLPQMLYWNLVTGHYIYYSYGGGTFPNLGSPKMLSVLFSVESGWLIYSPVFLIFLISLFFRETFRKYHGFAISLIFLSIWYMDASWYIYSFACSFGYRAIIEFYPLFIIPMTYFISKIIEIPQKHLYKSILVFLLLVFSFTSIRMSLLYYREKCWVANEGFSWVNYNKVLNKVFFLLPKDSSVK
jgi:hypothetical protein